MKSRVFLIIILVGSFLLFMLGNMMTTTPGRSSGNGNPALLLFIPLSVLFVVLVIQWILFLKDKRISLKTIFVCMMFIAGHFIGGMYYQFVSFKHYRDLLAQVYMERFGFIDWQYIHAITTGITIHVNNQYFNLNTYVLFISFSLFVCLLFLTIRQLLSAKK